MTIAPLGFDQSNKTIEPLGFDQSNKIPKTLKEQNLFAVQDT